MRTASLCIILVASALTSCCPERSNSCWFQDLQDEVLCRSGHSIQESQCHADEEASNLLNDQTSLENAMKVALIQNKKLLSLYWELGVASADLMQAGLYKNPIAAFSFKLHPGTGGIYDIGLLQNFLDILLKPLERKVASAEYQVRKNTILTEILNTLTNVKRAYYSLQAAEKKRILQKELTLVKEAEYLGAKLLRQAGNIPEIDVSVRCVDYKQSEIEYAQSELTAMQARENLTSILGISDGKLDWNINLEEEPLTSYTLDPKMLIAYAVANNLKLSSIKQQICALSAKTGINVTEMVFPEFGLGIDSEKEPEGSWFVGPQFSIAIPLFDIGQAQRLKAFSELQQLCSLYAAHMIDLKAQGRLSIYTLTNTKKRYEEYLEGLIPETDKLLSEGTRQLNAMQIGVFDVLSLKEQALKARVMGTETYRELQDALAHLELLVSGYSGGI